MEVARQAAIRVIWNNKNVTADVSPYLSSVNYTDREEGASDEATFVFDNSSGIWSEELYPTEGDTIELWMGYQNKLMNAGLFQVDEITLSGLPDVIEIKAISAGITKALRTRNSKAFEESTLKQIALFYCHKHSLTLIDKSQMLGQINLERKTQENKTDLAFLAELAKEFGFLFSVKGNKMVFTSYYDLDNADAVRSIDKTELSGYTFTEKTFDTYAGAELKQRNKKKGKVVSVKNIYSDWNGKPVTEDMLLVNGKAANAATAEAKVKGGLWNKNKFKQAGSLNNMEGDPELVAGMNVEITGFGMASGKYHIVSSAHTISGDSVYSMSLEVRKTGTVPKPKRVPRIAKPAPTPTENALEATGEEEY